MAEKSARRQMLEQSLAEDPGDTFLRYGLAMQCLREGDVDEGRERLRSLIADHPDDQIVAYQQLGQSYAETGETEAAMTMLQTGHRQGAGTRGLACSFGDGATGQFAAVTDPEAGRAVS